MNAIKAIIFTLLAALIIPAALHAAPKGGANEAPQHKSTVLIEETDETIVITIRSAGAISLKKSWGNGRLVFSFSPRTDDSFAKDYDKGLVNSISCHGPSPSEIVVSAVSEPYTETKEGKDGSFNTAEITIHTNLFAHTRLKRPAIKTKSTYKPGESLLTDMAVILDSSSRKSLQEKAMRSTGPLNRVLIATEKPTFRKNLRIMSSGKKPDREKAGSGLSSLKPFIPIEKSESLNVKFNNRNISEIIKYLADKSGKNVMISPLVKGKKSIEFTDMSPEEALGLLLAGTEYEYRIMRNAIIAGPSYLIDEMSRDPDPFSRDENRCKKIYVMKKIRGEKAIKTLKRAYPEADYTFYPKLNAFEITADSETVDEIIDYLKGADNAGN